MITPGMQRIKNSTLEHFNHTESDAWRWRPAGGPDTTDIVAMAKQHFDAEVDDIFVTDPVEYSRNIVMATVNQFYNPRAELISVARHAESQALMAYTWAQRAQAAAWSREEMIVIKMAHMDMKLPARQRVALLAQMIRMWETWADACEIRIICSTTMRGDIEGYMRLHAAAGFSVRGSIAYKRIDTATFAVDADFREPLTAASTSYNPDDYRNNDQQHRASSAELIPTVKRRIVTPDD
jgi:hypothetical protein